ncbi:hypothetical protein BIW11_12434 [Tropilaelaps mercedesae]|uniref:Uncharacterized protein n=1 Tax=Tropilaelaps mercedesae TaxID=418985 RepID=A0A1V9X710_9ACAR|nr:hypothetical protein BIW11_12434 [Tropilaelaps mercedesae]
MVCEVMDAHPMLEDDRQECIQVEELKQQLDHLSNRNQQLEQLVERLRRENAELLRKVDNEDLIEATRGTAPQPPPPPPPLPPPSFVILPHPPTQLVKRQRNNGSKKSLDKVKQDEVGSKQSQLIMEVVNFLKSGGLGKSRRQRSMTQPDLSQDLAKFKESRSKDTKEVVVEKFKSLKRRTDKGECLTNELDALKTSYKENVSPKDSPLSTSIQSHSRLRLGKSVAWTQNEVLPEISTQPLLAIRKIGSVPHIRLRIKSSPKDGSEADSRASSKINTPITSRSGPPSETSHTSRKSFIHQNYSINRYVKNESKPEHSDVEEQEAHIKFETDLSSQNSNSNMRASSRSNAIASSLLSERLLDLSSTSEVGHRENETCYQKTSRSASSKINVTPVEDLMGNPPGVALKVQATFNEKEIDVSRDEHRQKEEKTQQEFIDIVPSLKKSENLAVNGFEFRSPTIAQGQGTPYYSTKDKRRFWEDAVAIGSEDPRCRSGMRGAKGQSPALERFQTASRMVIKNKNQLKSSSGGHSSGGRQAISSSQSGTV